MNPTTLKDQLFVLLDHIQELDGGLLASQLLRLLKASQELAHAAEGATHLDYGGVESCCDFMAEGRSFHSPDCPVAIVLSMLDPEWAEEEVQNAWTNARQMNAARKRRKAKAR